MIKKIKRMFLIVIIILLCSEKIYAFELEEIIENEIEKIEIDDIQKEINKCNKKFKEFDIKKNIADIALQRKEIDKKEIINKFLNKFIVEVKNNISVMGYVIVISILSGLIKALTDSFKEKSVSEISNFIIYIVLIGIIMSSVNDIKTIYQEIVVTSTNIIKVGIPSLTGLLLLTGKIKTASLFEPITFVIINMVTLLFIKIVIPLINILLVLIIINYISNREILKDFIENAKELMKSSLKYIVGFVLGLSYISKITAGVFDGTMKKMIGATLSSVLPVVGTSMESISSVAVNAISLVKNSLGITLIIGIIITIITPVIKLASIIIIYKISVIMIGQVADEKILKCLKDISELMTFLFTSIVMIQLIYIIDITMIFSY